MPQFDFNQPTADLRQIDDGPFLARAKEAVNGDLYVLGDLATALGLSDVDEWKAKVDKNVLQTEFTRALADSRFQSRVQGYMAAVSSAALRTRTRRFASYGGVAGALAGFLCSSDFIDYVARMSDADAGPVLRTELYKLSVLDPELALKTTNHVFYSLALRRAVADPLGTLKKFSSAEMQEGLSRIINNALAAAIGTEERDDLEILATVRTGALSGADVAAWIILGLTERAIGTEAQVAAVEKQLFTSFIQKPDAVVTASASARYGLAVARVLRWASVGASIYGMVKQAESLNSDADRAQLAYLVISTISGPGIEATVGKLLSRYAPPALATLRNVGVTIWQGGRNGAQATFSTAASMAAKLAKFAIFLSVVGVAGEVVNFVMSAIELHNAIQGGDSGTIGFAAANLVVAFAGVSAAVVAAAGVILEASAITAVAGPFALAVAVVGVALLVGGLMYSKEQRRRAEQEREARLNLWRTWCRSIFTRCGHPASA